MSARDYFWLLEKVSLPHAWEKRFETEDECREELLSHVCDDCLKGEPIFDLNEAGEWEEIGEYENPPDPNSLRDLLGTSCGLEFEVSAPSKYGDI